MSPRFGSASLILCAALAGCSQQAPPTPAAVAVPQGSTVTVSATPPAPSAEPNGAVALAAKYKDRTRLLHEAAEKGQVSLLVGLLKQGADPNDKDDTGQTALHKAATKGNRSAVIALLTVGADAGERDAQGRNPMHAAAENGHHECLAVITSPQTLKNVAGDIFDAAGGKDAIKGLGLNLDKAAERMGQLSNNAADAADALGQTPLMKAAANGHVESAKAFWLANSTRIQARDKQGRTPTMLAAAGGHAAMVEYLAVWYGANLEHYKQSDSSGKTTAQLAQDSGNANTVKAVREAMLVAAVKEGNMAELRQLVGERPATELPGRSMLATAVNSGNLTAVRYLMDKWKERPVDEKSQLLGFPLVVGQRTTSGFHDAASGGHLEILKVLADSEWWGDKAVLVGHLRTRDAFIGLPPAEYGEKFGAHKPEADFIRGKLKELDEKK